MITYLPDDYLLTDKELANIEANMNVILDRDKPEITKDKSSL